MELGPLECFSRSARLRNPIKPKMVLDSVMYNIFEGGKLQKYFTWRPCIWNSINRLMSYYFLLIRKCRQVFESVSNMSGNLKVKSLLRDLERAQRKEKWREAGEIANQLGFLFRQIIIFLFLCIKIYNF